jgi:spore germination protein YaaH
VIRRTLPLAALSAGALLLGAAAPGGAQAASSKQCATVAPGSVSATPNAAGNAVAVRWTAPRKHPAKLAYRVARDGAVVGQTSGRKYRVIVSPGRATKITLTAIVAGHKTRCKVVVPVQTPAAAAPVAGAGGPGPVSGLSVRPKGRRFVVLSWNPATRGANGLRNYRVLREGKAVRKTSKRKLKVRIGAKARYQVVAVDKKGRQGGRSGTVVVRSGHVAPTKPAAPAVSEAADTAVTLSWRRSRALRGAVRQYWLIRDGRIVRGVKGTSTRLTGLPTGRALKFRIVAVDSLGWASKSSDDVVVQTGHAAPPAPQAPTAINVSDTSLTLGWDPVALPGGSKLRGYRVIRDGKVVAQVPNAQATFGNLAPKSTHDWSVATVDTLGYVSPPSSATRIVQTDPPPTTGNAQAFLLASTSSSFTAFRKHYQQIGVVYPTFWDCNSNTAKIEGRNDQQIVDFARDRKVKVLPRFNCQNPSMINKILWDQSVRAEWLNTITKMIDDYGYDGVNIDFEAGWAKDRDALSQFMRELSGRVHAKGKLLSQAVSAKTEDVPNHPRSTFFDYKELVKSNDYVFVMAWGVHWATSAPGPQDDFSWVRQVVDYVSTMPNREKFVMGTMLYGMDWANGGREANPGQGLHYSEIQALIARTGARPEFDPTRNAWHLAYSEGGTPHDLWYSDANAVGDRMALARDRGMGVGFWRIGQEDEGIWSHPRLQK